MRHVQNGNCFEAPLYRKLQPKKIAHDGTQKTEKHFCAFQPEGDDQIRKKGAVRIDRPQGSLFFFGRTFCHGDYSIENGNSAQGKARLLKFAFCKILLAFFMARHCRKYRFSKISHGRKRKRFFVPLRALFNARLLPCKCGNFFKR